MSNPPKVSATPSPLSHRTQKPVEPLQPEVLDQAYQFIENLVKKPHTFDSTPRPEPALASHWGGGDAISPSNSPPVTSPRTETRTDSISQADYAEVAQALGVSMSAIKAVAQVESEGSGMLASGKPKVLFEAHVFARETGGRFNGTHPHLSHPSWQPGSYGPAGQHQWDRLEAAQELDPEAALKSASYGRFQIMGLNYKRAGYPDVQSFVEAMGKGEAEQFRAFANFIKSDPKMHAALRNHDWVRFAYAYNGAGQAHHNYSGRIAEAFKAINTET